jgi:hypothetical protein
LFSNVEYRSKTETENRKLKSCFSLLFTQNLEISRSLFFKREKDETSEGNNLFVCLVNWLVLKKFVFQNEPPL